MFIVGFYCQIKSKRRPRTVKKSNKRVFSQDNQIKL